MRCEPTYRLKGVALHEADQAVGDIISQPILGGLHYRYTRIWFSEAIQKYEKGASRIGASRIRKWRGGKVSAQLREDHHSAVCWPMRPLNCAAIAFWAAS